MTNTLEKTDVIIQLSEPWDLGEILKWKPLEGVILKEKIEQLNSSIIIQLEEPFDYKNVSCEYFVASPRYEGDSFENLKGRKGIFSGLTRISKEQFNSSDPFDLSWWRGGIALLGEILIVDR